jgi:hypothetical protein
MTEQIKIRQLREDIKRKADWIKSELDNSKKHYSEETILPVVSKETSEKIK